MCWGQPYAAGLDLGQVLIEGIAAMMHQFAALFGLPLAWGLAMNGESL